jgi:retrograde regulation protein 2
MGSNGIRFSITSLSPPTSRLLPTIFQDRIGISLYDAQYPAACSGIRMPIPDSTIQAVVKALLRFKRTCQDFRVPEQNVHLLATEATRTAPNSASFLQQIKQATGWIVTLLPKEDEGIVGAMGVASSAKSVQGLVMDLGGGSTQMTWLSEIDGVVKIKEGGSASLPYGAAALTRRLNEAQNTSSAAVDALAKEVRSNIAAAWNIIRPDNGSSQQEPSNFDLFLSGGGFRGWGSTLLSMHPVQPYPIPLINGFTVPATAFRDTSAVTAAVSESISSDERIFRVSERRATQIPAVAFLVMQLTIALPKISIVRFAQGGVREGFLFGRLSEDVRGLAPLDVATRQYATKDVDALFGIMNSALPAPSTLRAGVHPPQLIRDLVRPLTSLLYTSLHIPREARTSVALRLTTSGALAGVHGLSHMERASLSLMLCEVYGGLKELPPSDMDFYKRLMGLVDREVGWWGRYVGRVGACVIRNWAAGVVTETRMRFEAIEIGGVVRLRVTGCDKEDEGLLDALERVEKLGKKKNWIGGREGWGLRTEIIIE